MLWQEEENHEEYQVPDDVVDVHFDIICRELPVDHIHDLAKALEEALPWLTEDAELGIHEIHLAGSQNGWERPEAGSGQRLILSRRTKLVIRTPKHKADQLQQEMMDLEMEIDDCLMVVGKAKVKLLSSQGTLYAHHVALRKDEVDDEDKFLQRIASELAERGILIKKALCGKSSEILTSDDTIPTRSIMLADLSPADAIALQEQGLGPHRNLGCGIFLPMKGINKVAVD
jgi:CRISPR-associated protein Cas6